MSDCEVERQNTAPHNIATAGTTSLPPGDTAAVQAKGVIALLS